MHALTHGRRGRLLKAVAPTLAAAAVTAVGFAAFTDDASNAGNRATAASVTITEDVPATSALFDIADWQPQEEDTVQRCVAVRNEGSIALPLKLRLKSAPTGQLGDYVDVRVEVGSRPASSTTSSCAAFTKDATVSDVYNGELSAFPTTAATALSDKAGALAKGASRAYRITWRLQDDEGAEGKSVSGVDFVWETTSAN